jgi:hypothetical protein
MIMNRIKVEHALYVLAFALAITVRFLNLGTVPLSDIEANWALQALHISLGYTSGSPVILGSQPAYIFLTGLSFSLLGSSNGLARFWPALVGSMLVLAPLFFRPVLGRKAALVLAFGLALDPGMVAVSRLVGGPILAIGFGVWALGLAYDRHPLLAGIFAGLALLSGPAILQGLLGLLLAWGIIRLLISAGLIAPLDEPNDTVEDVPRPVNSLRTGISSAVVTILIVGTAFFRVPQGLGAWMAALPDYLSGWVSPSGIPSLRLLAALAIYQPLALIFGIIGAVRVWLTAGWEYPGYSLAERMGIWLVIALGLALLYPARQVADLAWVLLPLWTLAAIEFAYLFSLPREQWYTSASQAALVFVLLVLLWLNLAGFNQVILDFQATALRWGILIGVIVLGALTTVLVALGWSWNIARQGLVWGLTAALGVYTLGGMWGVSQLHANERQVVRQELWDPTPLTGEADLLLKTLGDLSEWNTGLRTVIDITVADDAPSLRWALRDFSQARFVGEGQVLPAGETPSVIITRKTQETPNLTASYRGQDFGWWKVPAWSGALPPDFFRWLAFRQSPVEREQLILWARGDLFPGGTTGAANTTNQPAQAVPTGEGQK